MDAQKEVTIMINEYDVSIVLISYNPTKDKIFRTLSSLLSQKGVRYEIIIADDGSEENYFIEIEKFFKIKGFQDFKLIANNVNKGTVCNYFSAVSVAVGKYIKGISPGDMLYRDYTLQNWIDYMEKKDLKWSFSEVINYQLIDDVIVPIETPAIPINIRVYKKEKYDECRWNYFVLGDIPIGASFIGLRTLQVEYCKRILNKVVYAEDNIWRMMMFDGIIGGYYSEYAILYEYGVGVSTSRSNIWETRLKKDLEETDKILFKQDGLDSFQVKMKQAETIIQGNVKYKKIFVKGYLKNKLSFYNRMSVNYLP